MGIEPAATAAKLFLDTKLVKTHFAKSRCDGAQNP